MMAATSDKSGKPDISMRFSEMTAQDDDEDLDLFTARNIRTKHSISGVPLPSCENDKRPTSIHDDKKDSSRNIFDEFTCMIAPVISRKLEELEPEEKFGDVKGLSVRKLLNDNCNPLTNIFETEDIEKGFDSGNSLSDGMNVHVTPQTIIVLPDVTPEPAAIYADPIVVTRIESHFESKADSPVTFDLGDHCESDLMDTTDDDDPLCMGLTKTITSVIVDSVPYVVGSSMYNSDVSADETVSDAELTSFVTKRTHKIGIPIPPALPRLTEEPSLLKAVPPLNDPLNELLHERNKCGDDYSDTDYAHDSLWRKLPNPVADSHNTSTGRESPAKTPSSTKSETPAQITSPEVSNELSDDKFEPLEDFFGGVYCRASDSRSEGVKHMVRRSSNSPSSTTFNILRKTTNRSPERTSALKHEPHAEEEIKNVREPLNLPADGMPLVPENSEYIEEFLKVPLSTLESSALALKMYWKICATFVFLLAYAVTPLPSYVSGLITGAMISAVCMAIYVLMTKPRQKEGFSVPELNSSPTFLLPEIKDCRSDNGIYKGWLNELSKYGPSNYHISDASSVYVTLDGSTLRLQRPKKPIPKRAMWNENIPPPKFIHQRYYDIIGAKISLEPPNLVKKRLWSKKYPLCITIKTDKKNISENNIMSFEVGDKAECSLTLYFFVRTCRDKEEWYRRLIAAAKGQPLVNYLPELSKLTSANSTFVSFRNVHELIPTVNELREGFKDSDKRRVLDYAKFMAKFMPAEHMVRMLDHSHADMLSLGHVICDSQLMWLNALIGRVAWDLLREKFWADKVYERIQKKLSKIHVPIFINEITISDLELGNEIPIIRRASKPYLDARGLWVDLEIAYAGGFKMTLETKCNLMKLKRVHGSSKMYSEDKTESGKAAVYDSEEDDSCESSTDEEELPVESDNVERTIGTGQKFLRIVDKITNSRYFQQATDIKYIRRAMEGVSNTPLVLGVEIHSLIGTLAVNIPAPPTDRIWYGFRTNTRLLISAKPKVGDRQLTVTPVTDWIERKIASEFQKLLVLPNMDDVSIPVMNEGLINNS